MGGETHRDASGALGSMSEQKELVNHPAHYGGDVYYEVIKIIDDWGLGFSAGNALKYILRAPHKGSGYEDLKKAAWYLRHAGQQRESVPFLPSRVASWLRQVCGWEEVPMQLRGQGAGSRTTQGVCEYWKLGPELAAVVNAIRNDRLSDARDLLESYVVALEQGPHCLDCGEVQVQTPSGWTCKNGHGGAPAREDA